MRPGSAESEFIDSNLSHDARVPVVIVQQNLYY
jgi:hypothetical protein